MARIALTRRTGVKTRTHSITVTSPLVLSIHVMLNAYRGAVEFRNPAAGQLLAAMSICRWDDR